MPKRRAIDLWLALIIGGSLAVLLLVFTLFTIRQIDSLADDNLRAQITAAETRLATSLPPQVWNFDVTLIRSTLNAELYGEAIDKIVVEGPGLAPITVSKSGRRPVRTSPFRSRLFYHNSIEKRVVPLGTLTIYSNDSLVSGRVSGLHGFIVTWLVSITLFIGILTYLATRVALVEPQERSGRSLPESPP